MAMMDDRAFLVQHIRQSFITSDDTGMCEFIITDGEESAQGGTAERHYSGTEKRPATWHARIEAAHSNESLESDTELAHSYDIVPDMDFASHRRRSNTAQRLEKLKREKHKQSKIKNIQWKDAQYSVDEIGDYFGKKEVAPKLDTRERKSRLSLQIDHFASVPNNPFMEFAKFDGKGQAGGGVPTKKIDIYLTMAEPKDRPFPMQIITIATAKISEMIGLICWQYTSEARVPEMQESSDIYSLHIAEDDGEVDMDFPALDNREPISKFGFAKLALVEKEIPRSAKQSSYVVTVNAPSKGFSKITIDNDSLLMKEIFEKVLVKRKITGGSYRGLRYMLEKQREPGVPVDLEAPLSAMGTLEFCMVRENSVRGDGEVEYAEDSMNEMTESLTSHQYKSYIVLMAHKLRTNTEVQLGVSGEKIEIDPVAGKGFLFKEKAITHDTDDVALCSVTHERSSGRATFQIIYHSGTDFKQHAFEADTIVAREIVQKVNNILELRSSPVRKDYRAYKEKKKQKRHTLPSRLNSLLSSP